MENVRLFLLSTEIWNTNNIATILIPIFAILVPTTTSFIIINMQNRINRITDEEIKRINEIKHNAIKFIYHRNTCYFYAANKHSADVYLEKNKILKYTEKLIFDLDNSKTRELYIINLLKNFNKEFISISWDKLNNGDVKSYFWQNSENIIEMINILLKDEWKRIKKRANYKEAKEKTSLENNSQEKRIAQ